eukprot:9467611-Pyramimonas_sp.AAC.1
MSKYTKAKQDNDLATQQALEVACPDLATKWKPPPVPTTEELLATNTQKVRQLQAQQGRTNTQLVAAAKSQKEVHETLLANTQQ